MKILIALAIAFLAPAYAVPPVPKWGGRVINPHTTTENTETIRIAIVDTGYDESLVKTKLKLCKDGHYNFANDKAEVGFVGTHGTIVAGIIAEALKGVNYCAVVLQVVQSGGIPASNIMKAFNRIEQLNITAVNLSLAGAEYSFYERAAIRKAAQKKTLVFAAAGNDDLNLDGFCNVYPACYKLKNMLIVGATDETGENRASYSNYGMGVSVWFPGHVMFRGRMHDGTSFATPRALSNYVSWLASRKAQ